VRSRTTTYCLPREPTCCVGSRHAEAADAYRQALAVVTTDAERRYLTRRLREVLCA
jgi:predicted RNA polymerase sigma factor